MKKQVIFVLAMVMAAFGFCVCQAEAADITFTSDGVIQDGDIYHDVRILNSATVDMSGGIVTHRVFLRDESTLNFSGGSVDQIWASDSSAVNVTGGSLEDLGAMRSSLVNIYNVEMINASGFVVHDSGSVNVYGGNISTNYAKIYPDAKVNIFGGNITFISPDLLLGPDTLSIYGYDFSYDPDSDVFTGSLAYGGQITISEISFLDYERLNLVVPEPEVINILQAIAEKTEMLKAIDEMLDKERETYEALEELLESGDYGDLSKGDIVKAKQKIHSAIQHQEQSKEALEKSIEKLKEALAALGWEPEPEPNLPEP